MICPACQSYILRFKKASNAQTLKQMTTFIKWVRSRTFVK